MKKIDLFFEPKLHEKKDFLNLLELTAKVHGEKKELQQVTGDYIWGEEFFLLNRTKIWESLSQSIQKKILQKMTEHILREAYFIETAGMAYAAKMNLTSINKEERQFFCFVAEEEAKHLRLVESLFNFDKSTINIPSFALLIGEIIQEAKRNSHLLLIQILLEGWGLNYYKTLEKSCNNEIVSSVFKIILKDEIRHHSAGVILFANENNKIEDSEFIDYIERITKMVQMGPYTLFQEVFSCIDKPSEKMVSQFLDDVDAVRSSQEKLLLVKNIIEKSLSKNSMDKLMAKNLFKALEVKEMGNFLVQSMPEIFQHQ